WSSTQPRNPSTFLRRKARWLHDFLKENPRGYNTPGGHLACGIIAVKRSIKECARRQERRDGELLRLQARQRDLQREQAHLSRRIAKVLPLDLSIAATWSCREAEMQVALDENRNAIFARRLEIQDALVAIFRQAWRECERSAPSPSPLSSRVLPEFEQPSRERPTLLPDGL